ncbi:MAG TPA: hypothetical protein VNT52_05070, partial [Acidimicrobiales bacterium]|nr:hypothetical protein [Acidimicrobiales bacterium]
ATIRNLFDGRDIEPLTKTSQVTATRPHVVITGHITAHELREKSTTNDAVNGLLNRFMVLHVYRPRLVPLPKPTDEAVLDGLAQKVADAIEYATGGDPLGEQSREVILTPEAERAWCEIYPQVTRDREGLAGSLMARSEMYCRLLAMVFALMDARSEIEPADLVQAVAWIEYWQQSVSYVFMTAEPEHELDTFETEVLMLIRARPGLKLSEVQDHWSRQKQDEVKAALTRLLELAPPLVEMQIDKPSRGRPAQRYFPASAHESDKSEKSQITNEKMGEKRVRKG